MNPNRLDCSKKKQILESRQKRAKAYFKINKKKVRLQYRRVYCVYAGRSQPFILGHRKGRIRMTILCFVGHKRFYTLGVGSLSVLLRADTVWHKLIRSAMNCILYV